RESRPLVEQRDRVLHERIQGPRRTRSRRECRERRVLDSVARVADAGAPLEMMSPLRGKRMVDFEIQGVAVLTECPRNVAAGMVIECAKTQCATAFECAGPPPDEVMPAHVERTGRRARKGAEAEVGPELPVGPPTINVALDRHARVGVRMVVTEATLRVLTAVEFVVAQRA